MLACQYVLEPMHLLLGSSHLGAAPAAAEVHQHQSAPHSKLHRVSGNLYRTNICYAPEPMKFWSKVYRLSLETNVIKNSATRLKQSRFAGRLEEKLQV